MSSTGFSPRHQRAASPHPGRTTRNKCSNRAIQVTTTIGVGLNKIRVISLKVKTMVEIETVEEVGQEIDKSIETVIGRIVMIITRIKIAEEEMTKQGTNMVKTEKNKITEQLK